VLADPSTRALATRALAVTEHTLGALMP